MRHSRSGFHHGYGTVSTVRVWSCGHTALLFDAVLAILRIQGGLEATADESQGFGIVGIIQPSETCLPRQRSLWVSPHGSFGYLRWSFSTFSGSVGSGTRIGRMCAQRHHFRLSPGVQPSWTSFRHLIRMHLYTNTLFLRLFIRSVRLWRIIIETPCYITVTSDGIFHFAFLLFGTGDTTAMFFRAWPAH